MGGIARRFLLLSGFYSALSRSLLASRLAQPWVLHCPHGWKPHILSPLVVSPPAPSWGGFHLFQGAGGGDW